MNRGQLKRLRKEIERLEKGGKAWDALALIEREKAVDEFRSQWDELWRSQSRHALRTSALMETFIQRSKEFSTVPDSSDFRFIKAVGDYLEGIDITATINSMKALSAPAEALRRELLRQGVVKSQEDSKLRKLLTLFATTPEKVLQKDYRQLQTLFASNTALQQTAFAAFEGILTRARKLNNSSTVEFKAHGVLEPGLSRLDMDIKNAASGLPPQLSKVVIAPILAQVSIALQRIATTKPERAPQIALAAPFCMAKLAGQNWDELRKKYQLETSHYLSSADIAELRKKAQNATFEERFALINKLVKNISRNRDFYVDIQDILIILFKGILREIAARRRNISERDQRRLAAVFGSFFAKNMDYLFGGFEELPFLLDSVAAVGCLDTVSALIHTYFAVVVRDRAMIANARSMLKLLPSIREEDVGELLKQYMELLADDLKAVKGMLEICRECGHELDGYMSRHLNMLLLSRLIMSSLLGDDCRNSLMTMFLGSKSDDATELCNQLIKGIECFSENPAFAAPLALARSFPTGKISAKEFGQFLEKQIDEANSAETAIANFVNILGAIKHVYKAQRMDTPFADRLGESLIKMLLTAGLDVLCGKKRQVMRLSTAELVLLSDIIRKYGDGSGLVKYMQIISNSAAERGAAGDNVAAKLYESTAEYILRAAKSDRKRVRRR